ncbi:MAG: OmpA family protein [Myxococcota bacterium]
MRLRFFRAVGLTLALLFAFAPGSVRAQDATLLTLEGGLAAPVVTAQRDRFGPGPRLGVGLLRGVTPWLLLGGGLDLSVLSNGESVGIAGVDEPGAASITALTGRARFRPWTGFGDDAARGLGPFLELGAGGALTGGSVRPVMAGGLGWGFALGPLDLSPVLRWETVFETAQSLEESHAHVLSVNVQVAFFDARTTATAVPDAEPEPPRDRDDDGLPDDVDACPDVPEDHDGFEDSDGCPDLDDDEDGIADADDACPRQPEDMDGFEDGDGCPEPDNDGDGVPDLEDHCPLEAERVNGIDDEDGCPDHGLVELVDDHIVLEERVLFQFSSAELKNVADPLIAAVVELIRQHPEWGNIRVEGHACELGPHAVNQRISEQRANAVRDALVAAGVTEDRVTAVGLGETRPRGWGESEDIHELNRRVEIFVQTRAEVSHVISPARFGGMSVEVRTLEGAAAETREAAPLDDEDEGEDE